MEPVTTMPVVEHVNACYPLGLLYRPLILSPLMSLVCLVLIVLLLLLLRHSVRASRSAQMSRLAHYIALTKSIGMIGVGAGFLYAAYRMVLLGVLIFESGGGSLNGTWLCVAFNFEYLVLGAGVFLWAHIQAAIFQLVAARADETPSCAQPVARGPNPRSPLDEEAAGE